MSLLCAASNRGDKRDSEWRHPPERARGPLPANPRAEFSQCGLLRNWRATIWRNERFWLEQAHPDRGHKRPLRAVQPGIERTEASEEYRNDWHRAAARWGGRGWVENRPRRLPADRYRRARNLLCRDRFRCSCRGCTLAHIEFKFPAAAVGGNAPKLEHARFCHLTFERNGNNLFARTVRVRRQKDFDWRQLFEIIADLFDQRTWRVVSPRERGKETELGGFADDEGELALRQFHFGAFFEAERNDRKSLHRRGEAGNSGQRGLDSDVIAARHATADADPFARPGESVISSSM